MTRSYVFSSSGKHVHHALLSGLIKDLHVREQYNVNIVSIKHAGAHFTHASPDTAMTTRDIIFAAGEVADVERFAHHASR